MKTTMTRKPGIFFVAVTALSAFMLAPAVADTVYGPAIWNGNAAGSISSGISTRGPIVASNPGITYTRSYGVQPFYPPAINITILPSYDNPYYSNGYTGYNYYTSVFGAYAGIPSYFYSPSVYITFDPDGNLVFDEIGSFYPYEFDPFGVNTGIQVTPEGQFGLELATTLDDFARMWANGNVTELPSYLPQSGNVNLGNGNQYAYSVPSSAYLQLAGNTLNNVTTTDFKYQSVRVKPNGDAVASAVQTYKAHDGSLRQSNLTIVFRPDSNSAHGYSITGFGVASGR